jgi:UDP-glucose 4-epimerase
MKVLVIGGAGYIGSVTSKRLLEHGFEVIVLDDLSRGHRLAVPEGCHFIEGDFGNSQLIAKVFNEESMEAVLHFGALSLVAESIENPALYYENNVVKGAALLRCMVAAGVDKFIFSSTAAVYGQPKQMPIQETCPPLPTNPYGDSKLAFERMLHWYSRAYGLRYISLRYFNAAGAFGELGEDHQPETHLIPLLLQVALGKKRSITIHGDNYSTADGTCIRDYIHVFDLAEAHIQALTRLADGKAHDEVFNLGSNHGYSVLEVVETVREVTGHAIPIEIGPRREGDPATLIASNRKATYELNWEPSLHLDDIVEDAWKWMQKFPNGYGGIRAGRGAEEKEN